MPQSEPHQFDLSGELALSTILPILERLETEVQTISERVSSFAPRKNLTEHTKQRHVAVVSALGGRCPCCGVSEVLDCANRATSGEFDHFFSRERNAFEDTWLICTDCHQSMKDRAQFTDEFRTYQRRAAAIENGQLQLI